MAIPMCEHNPSNTGQSYCAYCRVNELTAAADRVRSLHVPREAIAVCKECARDYPCATVKALDGAQ